MLRCCVGSATMMLSASPRAGGSAESFGDSPVTPRSPLGGARLAMYACQVEALHRWDQCFGITK